jgi:hypothetical protein
MIDYHNDLRVVRCLGCVTLVMLLIGIVLAFVACMWSTMIIYIVCGAFVVAGIRNTRISQRMLDEMEQDTHDD